MKSIVLTIVVAGILTGCANWRTGTICVEPFTTIGFKTSNPIDVKQDSVDYIRDQIPEIFKKQIEAETKLTVEADCSKADYVVSGRVEKVDTAIQGSSGMNIFGGYRSISERTFGIGIQGLVKKNITSETVFIFDDYQHYSTLNNTLWALSRKVLYGAQYVNSQ